MKLSLTFITLAIISIPRFVNAEPIYLECNIKYKEFSDDYSISVDLETRRVDSSFHAAHSKNNNIVLDYSGTAEALLDKDKIIYKINRDSLDWIFVIDRKTLQIERYISDSGDEDFGRGSCKIIEVSGRKSTLAN